MNRSTTSQLHTAVAGSAATFSRRESWNASAICSRSWGCGPRRVPRRARARRSPGRTPRRRHRRSGRRRTARTRARMGPGAALRTRGEWRFELLQRAVVSRDHNPLVPAGPERAPIDHPLQRRVRHVHEFFGAATAVFIARAAQDDEAASWAKLVPPVVKEGLPAFYGLPGEGFLYRTDCPVGPDVAGDGGRDAAEPVNRDRVPANVEMGLWKEPLVERPAPRVYKDVARRLQIAVRGGQQREQRIEIVRRQVGVEDGDGEVVGSPAPDPVDDRSHRLHGVVSPATP
jgi:hypothetical protein